MLKTRELVGIIKNALIEMDGCISKPDENGYVGIIETNTKINDHCIFLEYVENGEKDRYMITVERVQVERCCVWMKITEMNNCIEKNERMLQV